MPPYNRESDYKLFGGTYCLHLPILMTEAAESSETLLSPGDYKMKRKCSIVGYEVISGVVM
jgi:hypothetical protein